TKANSKKLTKLANEIIVVPEVSDQLLPIVEAIVVQLFSYYTALARGTDIDKPRNLAKSVTVE
ncbi:glutamine--fructose-6-phosphate aminotransferase, partial [Candidatus Saccharibacteria bacterium]|nr:glutamine--fructose-6-phosphate aminotransferase [Candidatus Saccharibacteria bacterium]